MQAASPGGERHTHRIAVETGPQPVFVTIGAASGPAGEDGVDSAPQGVAPGIGHAPVPGGFAKFFNRIIDCGSWAAMPEAARAVYMPLVRFAEARDGFRVRIGLAALMRYTGLSRSSVKRGLRALHEARLLAVVRAGGVGPDGANRSNIYQLLMPEPESDQPAPPPSSNAVQSAARAKRGKRVSAAAAPGASPHVSPTPKVDPISAHAAFDEVSVGQRQTTPPPLSVSGLLLSLDSWGGACDPAGSWPNPLPAPGRSPSVAGDEPRPWPTVAPVVGHRLNPAAGSSADATEAGGGPLHRSFHNQLPTEQADAVVGTSVDEFVPERAAERRQVEELLRRWGVEATTARDLAASHPAAQVQAAIALARQARARGRLRNPGGFLVRCLSEAWVAPAGEAAPIGVGSEAAARQAREQEARQAEQRRALEARAGADARIDELDDETFGCLVARVLAMHAARPAMLRLLHAKPPRACRLMRAEVAALLEAGKGVVEGTVRGAVADTDDTVALEDQRRGTMPPP